MNSKHLFSAITQTEEIPDGDILVVTEDSRRADEASVFVCIRGALSDGHRYADSAYQKGCRFFVAEKSLNLPKDAFVLETSDTRKSLALLACRLYGDPSHSLKVIGITGTKGKTTTAQMLAHILNENNLPTGYIGTNGIRYGAVQEVTANTTPDAVTLQQTILKMKESGMRAVVIEVSSQALMQHRVTGIRFDTVLFTNLFPDHIGVNEHPDFEHYKDCKKKLFRDFGAGNMILNADGSFADEFTQSASVDRILSCSAERSSCDYAVDSIRLITKDFLPCVAFELLHKDESFTCRLPMIGKSNAYNALLSVACAHAVFEIPISLAAEALTRVSVSGRSETLPLPGGACVVIDYAHNGESLRQLLESLRAYRPSRLICLFGSVGDRTRQRRREMGAVAAELSDLCILTSDNPGLEDPQKILDEIAQAFEGTGTPYYTIVDRKAAIIKALEESKMGDILVLAGKGHEAYQLVGKEKLPFSEKEIVEDFIKEKTVLL